MERAPGARARPPGAERRATPPTACAPLSLELVEHLADLHAVDPAAVGLERLRPPRRLPRPAAVDAGGGSSTPRARARRPTLDALQDSLAERHARLRRGPESCTATSASTTRSSSATADDPHISAILDWEMATLGDPLVDLGIFAPLLGHREPARRRRGRGAERRRPGRRATRPSTSWSRSTRDRAGHRHPGSRAGTARSRRTSSP